MQTERLIRVLRAAGLDLTPLEVAEAVWFAEHTEAPMIASTTPDEVSDKVERAADKPSPTVSSDPDIFPNRPLELPLPNGTGTLSTGFYVKPPDAPALPDSAAIRRSLRPLKRSVASSHRTTMDEVATTDFIAATGIWSPVLRPAAERWLDVALVVDSAPSMRIWRELASEFKKVLIQLGAFRDVRTWNLSADGTLTSGPIGVPRQAAELVDATRRRIFLVLSDVTADVWWNGVAARILARWSTSGPVAVLQPLPERMWSRTGLPPSPGTLSAVAPGLPNTQLRFIPRRRQPLVSVQPVGVPIPHINIGPPWIDMWARLFSASCRAGVELPASLVAPTTRRYVAEKFDLAGFSDDPDVLVREFTATASPDAYKLAVCLSTLPLSLPVMRIVQRVVMDQSNPGVLAEVLLSGLVVETSDSNYNFVEGVRPLLRQQLRRSEATAAKAAIAGYLSERGGGLGRTFPGVVTGPGGIAVNVDGTPLTFLSEPDVQRLDPGLRWPDNPRSGFADLALVQPSDSEPELDRTEAVDPQPSRGSRNRRIARLVRESWAALEEHHARIADYFFARIFLSNPELRDLFPVELDVARTRMFTTIVGAARVMDDIPQFDRILEGLGRSHRKYHVEPQHHAIMGVALAEALRQFGSKFWTSEYDDAWRSSYAAMAERMMDAARRDSGNPPYWYAEVVSHERRTSEIAVMTCQPLQNFPYRAGQFVSVECPRFQPRLWRNYFIANAPREDGSIDLHVRAASGGAVSSALVRRVGIGEMLRLGPPGGNMIIDERSRRDICCVASGTGVAPIKALIESLAPRNLSQRWVTVFVGASRREDLYDYADLRRQAARYRWLSVVPATEDDSDFPGEHGRVNDVMARYGPWKDHDFYLAGPPAMIRATLATLKDLQVGRARIQYDEEILAFEVADSIRWDW